jgi:acid stress chaperone HdeB
MYRENLLRERAAWHSLIPACVNTREAFMRNLMGTCLGSLLAWGNFSTGLAQTTIDVAKITCDQLVLMKVADPDQIAIWLSGYYHGTRNNTKVDVEQLKENANKVRSYCLYNGKGTVMEAIEKLLVTGK